MKFTRLLLLLLLPLFLSLIAIGQQGDYPKEAGTYYKKSDNWVTPERAYVSKQEVRNQTRALIGIGHAYWVYIYSGNQASLQVGEQKPTFYFVYDPAVDYYRRVPGIFKIIRLEQKKGNRELQGSSGRLFTDNSLEKKLVTETQTKSISDRVLAITPVSELKPGEYLFIINAFAIGADAQAFEFGVSTNK